ncbi:hypothetical protein NDU88_001508 [Pleurodeles waltl]|uniref:Beta/gamma crystallin 'Greek key' domain-containing protein n=1 Tax=Pleurodeles waltl TaxID=8319 RepID=A0AAV7TIG9_PLEWA|nr:hypothetical protein NDU88_001508 [Pleurodeles waltl]
MPPGKPGHNVVSNKVTTSPSETDEQNESSSLMAKSLQEPNWQNEVHSTETKSRLLHNTTCSITTEQQSNGQDVFDGIGTTFNSKCESQNEECSTASESLPKPITQNAASRALIELAPKGNNQSLNRGIITEASPKINSQDKTSRALQEFLPNSIQENEASSNVKGSYSNHQISENWAAIESLGEKNDNQVESTSGVPNSVAKNAFESEDHIKECNTLVKIPCQERDGLQITTPATGSSSHKEIDSSNAISTKENFVIKLHEDIAAVTLEQEVGELSNKRINGDSPSQHSMVDDGTILLGETSMDNIDDDAAPKSKILVTDNEVVVTSSEQSSRQNLESMDTMLPPDGNFQGTEGGSEMSSTKHMHTSSTVAHLLPAEGSTLPHSMVEESEVAADMESWVDIVRNLETPEIMKHPRVVKLPRTSALSVYATLPPITEDGGSPRSSEPLPGISDTENRLSPPVDEEEEEEMEVFEPASDIDSGVVSTQDGKEMPATGDKPRPIYTWESIPSRSKDLEKSSPLEMMRRHREDDSNHASRTTGYRSTLDQNKPQRQSCSTGTLLLSERLEKKANPLEGKPYSRLDSLLFNSYKICEHTPFGGMKNKETLKNGLTTPQVPLVPSSDSRSQPSPDEPLGKDADPKEEAPAISPSPLPTSLPSKHLPRTPHTSSSRVSCSTEAKQSKVQPQAELRAFPDNWQHQERERGKLNPRPGKMVIFSEPGLQGDQHEIWGDVCDATVLELPSAISIRVIRGGWVMYEKPRFQGRKIVLEEGDTELTDPWGDEDPEEETMTPVRIGSLRHVVRDYAVPAISLFAEENGEGKTLKFLDASHDARMFGQPLKTASIIVHSGLWVVYQEPFFEGQPSILEPGGYPTMKAWGGEEPLVCSLQPIQIGCPTVEKPYEPKIIMFESPDFDGCSWEINQDMLDLKNMQDVEGTPLSTTGSLRILGGCWVGYEKEGFRGQQYLLEEGEYRDWKDWGGNNAELMSIRLIRTDFSEPALVLYAEPDFEDGPSLEICDALPDVELARYGTSTQSIFVQSGVWVAYENVDYSGTQYILEKGTYHCFQDWGASNSRISSLQPVLQVGDPSLHYESKIQLFTEPGFHGDDLIYEEEAFTLPEGFNPQSCRVHGGSWILYENVDFSGEQYVLSEGEYPSHNAMGCMSHTVIRSLMQVPIHFSEPSISLHGLESFEGKEIELTSEVRSLQAEGFNNHVLSVRVRGGIWVLYEHCDYRGRQWLLDSTEITNWPQYSGLQHIGSLCPIQQRRIYFHVRNRALQQFLCVKEDIEDMKAARVLVSEPSDQAQLIWYYEEGRIKNHVAPAMSLQVIGSAHNGAKVVLWSQNRIPYQTWRIDSNGHICNQMFDGMILDVKGGQAFDQDQAVLWDVAEERPTQLWTIEVL